MAIAVDFAINPADTTQVLILYSNGRIYERNVVMPADYETWRMDAYETMGKPSNFQNHFTRIQVTSWSPLGGYVLRDSGVTIAVAFGNAAPMADLGPSTDPQPFIQGVFRGWNILRAFKMDPAGNGNGYVMSRFGRIYRIGTAATLTTNQWNQNQSLWIDFVMDWSTKKTVLLDQQGRLAMGNGAVYAGISEKNTDTLIDSTHTRWQSFDWTMFRRLAVVDWTGTQPKGYALDSYGYMHRFNSPEVPIHRRTWRGRDVAKSVQVITYPSPFSWITGAYNGTYFENLSSTAPTVTITNPGTVTTTTRPYIEWDISDKEADPEDYTEIHFFHTGTFTPGTTTPAEKIILRGSVQHSVRPNLPMPNGTVGVAVRATEVSRPGISGLVTAWDSETWTQSVTRPTAPSLSLNPQNSPPRVAITVTAAGGAGENGRIADLEYTDVASPAETDWQRVRYVDGAMPLYAGSGTFVYNDREVPAGVARKYRARTVINDDTNYNSSLFSTTSALTTSSIPPLKWWIAIPEALAAEVSNLQLAIDVQPGVLIEHNQKVSAALPIDSGYGRGAIATRTRPRAKLLDLAVWIKNESDYTTLMRILDDGRVISITDVLGRFIFVQLRGSPSEETLRSSGVAATPWPMRHLHSVTIPLVEVRRPTVVDRLDIT